METLAIIQARTGSTRLPGKVLLDLEGATVLERVIERVMAAKLIDKVMVATTTQENDLPLVELCNRLGVAVYRGSEKDVLDRFYQAAKPFAPRRIVRITADCPLIDPKIIDQSIFTFRETKVDYLASQFDERLPDGEDVEVFSFEALKRAWADAKWVSEREHVTPYIYKNPKIFKVSGLKVDHDYSEKRWTLDNQDDYEFIRAIYSLLYKNNHQFGMEDVLELLKKNPDLEKLNSHIARNEGYAKSLREDKIVQLEGK